MKGLNGEEELGRWINFDEVKFYDEFMKERHKQLVIDNFGTPGIIYEVDPMVKKDKEDSRRIINAYGYDDDGNLVPIEQTRGFHKAMLMYINSPEYLEDLKAFQKKHNLPD